MVPDLQRTTSEMDALVQTLCAIGLHLEAADALLDTLEGAEGAGEAVRYAKSLTGSCLDSARHLGSHTSGIPAYEPDQP